MAAPSFRERLSLAIYDMRAFGNAPDEMPSEPFSTSDLPVKAAAADLWSRLVQVCDEPVGARRTACRIVDADYLRQPVLRVD